MSRRPNIQTTREKREERLVQGVRRKRVAAMNAVARRAPTVAPVDPYITCHGRGPTAREIPPAVRRWIDEEHREQLRRYRRIVRQMDALAPLREQWVREFFERITGPRGFSIHAGQRRTLAPSEIAPRPDRPWRVVW